MAGSGPGCVKTYITKGSGGNGVNTVYFIDTSGAADRLTQITWRADVCT
jgi:hypothetical protein